MCARWSALPLLLASTAAVAAPAPADPVAAAIAKMTIEEKAAQLQSTAPADAAAGLPAYDWWNEGLHGLAVTARSSIGVEDTDRVEVLVRGPRERPRRGEVFALGRDVHSVGPWPAKGIPGGQLGPNKNGLKW